MAKKTYTFEEVRDAVIEYGIANNWRMEASRWEGFKNNKGGLMCLHADWLGSYALAFIDAAKEIKALGVNSPIFNWAAKLNYQAQKEWEAPYIAADCALEAAQRVEFKAIFGVPLDGFINRIGWEVEAMDEFLGTEDGKSTNETIRERYGDRAVELVLEIIGVGREK